MVLDTKLKASTAWHQNLLAILYSQRQNNLYFQPLVPNWEDMLICQADNLQDLKI